MLNCLLLALSVALAVASAFPTSIGLPVKINKHPHQVSIRHRSCENCPYEHNCSGSIWSERVIVTAAHCVKGHHATEFLIVAGTNNYRGSDGAVARVLRIIRYIDRIDVALMELAVDLPINNMTIKAIPLSSLRPNNGTEAFATGWAMAGEPNLELLGTEMNVVSNELCVAPHAGLITDSLLCAISPTGAACNWDSGGPLVVNGELAGIASWSSWSDCRQANHYGVYVNVAYVKKWVESINADLSVEPHYEFL